MANDKWGIPFIYPTKDSAGVSGKGTAYFWQQNNDIRKDSDNCVVRIGKELDQIQVISTTTGEWEFPYDSGAEAYTLETETGHHSGGETHGCEGAEYMGEVTINTTPPRFRFKKQMYHGGTKYARPDFTHPSITQKIIGNGWRGFCIVRYNKKDGRSSGHDSVKLEMYFNQDPDNNLKGGWVKVGETEDKGGWGKGGDTCDGVPDQVITWSNVQFRYKSGTPEWSVHPRIPECEDGSNVHSIDEENMSFADSEKRGYGKRADMPRDIEMKILFKFASTNGKARLKNASLREIDPNIDVVDNPPQPEPGEEPSTSTQTLQGKLKLQWDLNAMRVSPCSGSGTGTESTSDNEEPTGGGGGTSGTTRFYINTATDEDIELSNSSTYDKRTRVTSKCSGSSSPMKSKILKQLDVKLKKVGSPGSGTTIKAKIWNDGGSVIYTSTTTIDPTTLTTSYVKKSFDFSGNTHAIANYDRVGVEFTGTSSSDYIKVPYTITNNIPNTFISNWENGAWNDDNDQEFSCEMWE